MKQTERSIFVWALYMLLQGFALLIIPMFTLSLFGYREACEPWVRFLGLLSLVLGFYYVLMVKYHLQVLYIWKVRGHSVGLLCMAALIWTGYADSRLLMSMAVEAGACLWTYSAIENETSA